MLALLASFAAHRSQRTVRSAPFAAHRLSTRNATFAAVPAPPISHFAVSRPSSPTAYLPDCNARRNRRATNLEGGPNSGRPLAFQVREFAFPATVLHSRPRLRFPMPLFPLPEHKIGIFVRFYPPKPPFSGLSSTKSGFLCAFALQNPRFRAFRAQNRHFCAFLPSETLIFGLFEHKIEVFVRFCPPKPQFSGFPRTKSGFSCSDGITGAGKLYLCV